jgi:glycosyl transferase family 25
MRIFVINLRRSVERRLTISRKLEQAGLPYDIFDAVDGELLDQELVKKIQDSAVDYKRKYGRPILKGEIGAAFSHLNVYKKIVDEKIGLSLILEDDIDFDDRLQALLKDNLQLERAIRNFELVLLGYCVSDLDYHKSAICSYWQRSEVKGVGKFGVPVIWYWSAIGYLVKYSAAQKLLRSGEYPAMQADYLTANSPSYGIKLGISADPIIWPGKLNDVSTIGGREFEYIPATRPAPGTDPGFKAASIHVSRRLGLYQPLLLLRHFKKSVVARVKTFRLKISPRHYQYIHDDNI